jgi:hypothetical protein
MLVSVNKKTVFVCHVPGVASYGVAMSAASDAMQCTFHIASAAGAHIEFLTGINRNSLFFATSFKLQAALCSAAS